MTGIDIECVCVCGVCVCVSASGLLTAGVCDEDVCVSLPSWSVLFRSLSAARLIKPNNTMEFIGNDCALLQSLHNYWSLIVGLWEHMCTSSIQHNHRQTSYLKMSYLFVLQFDINASNPARCERSVCKAPLPVTPKKHTANLSFVIKRLFVLFEQISSSSIILSFI